MLSTCPGCSCAVGLQQVFALGIWGMETVGYSTAPCPAGCVHPESNDKHCILHGTLCCVLVWLYKKRPNRHCENT